ncbi:hypothetical protein DFH07DRAFT_763744 [Mycena maculata]|uniref:Uncharacterized protein n=1 Tax=Mycena maculata TaxID=230809 RepID=A0AAD7KHZ7_9AGAR|nr:hypothetical protein DFH07DRAFT_763744 [Mycena maculata]
MACARIRRNIHGGTGFAFTNTCTSRRDVGWPANGREPFDVVESRGAAGVLRHTQNGIIPTQPQNLQHFLRSRQFQIHPWNFGWVRGLMAGGVVSGWNSGIGKGCLRRPTPRGGSSECRISSVSSTQGSSEQVRITKGKPVLIEFDHLIEQMSKVVADIPDIDALGLGRSHAVLCVGSGPLGLRGSQVVVGVIHIHLGLAGEGGLFQCGTGDGPQSCNPLGSSGRVARYLGGMVGNRGEFGVMNRLAEMGCDRQGTTAIGNQQVVFEAAGVEKQLEPKRETTTRCERAWSKKPSEKHRNSFSSKTRSTGAAATAQTIDRSTNKGLETTEVSDTAAERKNSSYPASGRWENFRSATEAGKSKTRRVVIWRDAQRNGIREEFQYRSHSENFCPYNGIEQFME